MLVLETVGEGPGEVGIGLQAGTGAALAVADDRDLEGVLQDEQTALDLDHAWALGFGGDLLDLLGADHRQIGVVGLLLEPHQDQAVVDGLDRCRLGCRNGGRAGELRSHRRTAHDAT